VGYYSRKDGLACIWFADENGKYEQTTDRASEVERLSQESNFYRRGKRRVWMQATFCIDRRSVSNLVDSTPFLNRYLIHRMVLER
jgi:hypothetical protein